MTRGRKPLMALREAVLIAKKRGETRQFMHEPGTICNFVIYCHGFVAHVRIKRVTRVHCSHAWIESEAADALAALRAIASGSGISRELWVFLPRGAFPVLPHYGYRAYRVGSRRGGDAGETEDRFLRAKPALPTQPATGLHLPEGPGKPNRLRHRPTAQENQTAPDRERSEIGRSI